MQPTTDAEEDEIESFNVNIHEETDHKQKQNMLIIIGDWNTKVGNKTEPNVVGKIGLRVRNEGNNSQSSVKPAVCLSQIHASRNETDNCTRGHYRVAKYKSNR